MSIQSITQQHGITAAEIPSLLAIAEHTQEVTRIHQQRPEFAKALLAVTLENLKLNDVRH